MSTSAGSPVVGAPLAASRTFNRWFIPVAALLIHICIGSVYAWSTFNKPINTILHAGTDDWFKAPYITFSTALILLGLSAAFGGPWVERNGPRKTAAFAAVFFCSGLLISALGLSMASGPSFSWAWASSAASVVDSVTSPLSAPSSHKRRNRNPCAGLAHDAGLVRKKRPRSGRSRQHH